MNRTNLFSAFAGFSQLTRQGYSPKGQDKLAQAWFMSSPSDATKLLHQFHMLGFGFPLGVHKDFTLSGILLD